MDSSVIVVAALLVSALLLLFFSAYYYVETRRDIEARGIADARVYYLIGLMVAVAVAELGAVVFIMLRAKPPVAAGAAGAAGPAAAAQDGRRRGAAPAPAPRGAYGREDDGY